MSWRTIKALSIYAIVGFWPVGLYLTGLVFVMRLGVSLRDFSSIDGLASFVFLVLPVVAVVGSHAIFQAQKSWRARTWVIYFTWCLIGFVCAFIVSASLGGASMAVVEGVASPFRFVQYAMFALPLLLLAHVLIVPYVFISVAVLRRANHKLCLWDVGTAAS
jgi:hypothetical protein